MYEVTLNTPESGKPDMAIFLPADNEEKARAAALEIMKRPVDAGYVVTGAQEIAFAMVTDIHDRMFEPIVA